MATISAKHDDAMMPEINVASLTGVLLVLLVVFVILETPIAPAGFQRELRSCGCFHVAKIKPAIRVVVNTVGQIFVNGTKVDTVQLYALLSELARKRGAARVTVTADTKVCYGTIIRILDASRWAGLEDVSFVTE